MNRQQRRRAARAGRKRGGVAPPVSDSRLDAARAAHTAGRLDQAEAIYDQLLSEDPRNAVALHYKGVIAFQHGRVANALTLMGEAIALRPDVPLFHENLGNVRMMAGDRDAAEAAYREAIRLDGRNAMYHSNLAALLFGEGRNLEAEAAARAAIELNPRSSGAYTTLAAILRQQGDTAGAEAALRRALEIDPDYEAAHSSLIFLHDFDPAISFAEQQAERRRWAARFGDALTERHAPHGNSRDPDRKLRIGYVSGDFRSHSAAAAFGPLILERDRNAFEAICYTTAASSDSVTKRFRAAADGWRPCWGRSDEDIAGMVRADGIDILVDLAGHSTGSRLLAFARKPAPVQVTGWGHCTGTGLRAIDYIFADAVLIPPQDAGYCAETVVALSSAVCLMPPAEAPEIGPLPRDANGYVTFGCLNRIEKIGDETLAAWSRLLAMVPDSRLFLKSTSLDDTSIVARLTARLVSLGIDPARVDLEGSTPWFDHMAAYRRVDVALDPFPNSGGITSIEALWMGVPVVTLEGNTPASRGTDSIVTAAGHAEWIGRTVEDYLAIAAGLAADPAQLAGLRAGLRVALAEIPLGNPGLYVREVEEAYRRIWRHWCAQPAAGGPSPTAPADTEVLFREATSHHGAGRIDAAITHYDRILARLPDHPEALHLKGVAVAQAGRLDDGIGLLQRAIAIRADAVDYHNNLGHLLWRAGRLPEAEAALRRAIEVAPGHAAAYRNLGEVLESAGRLEEALEACRRAAELEPQHSAVHGNLGLLLQRLGRPEESEIELRQAVTLDPASPEARNNLANVLKQLGRLEEAEAALREALGLRPDYANAWHNLGGVLMAAGRPGEAVAALERAVELNPRLAGAWANLSAGLNQIDRQDDAVAAARRAIAVAPGLSDAWNNLGVALRALGDHEAAEQAYRRAVALDPTHATAHSNLIFVLDFSAHYGIAELQAERRRWNALHAAPLAAAIRPHRNDRSPDRRLRIGYVSADFREHSAAASFGPMILAHDRAAFDVVCYCCNARQDAMTARFRAAAAEWRAADRTTDAALAETIRADGIDILVDLSGHTAGNRLQVFARKPAPLQVTAWGHAVGTGLDAIDYFLADPVVVPEAEAHHYAERIRYLPSLLTYLPADGSPEVTPPPCVAAGHVTFGSFNRLEKVSDAALELWREILDRVRGSRLLIKSQAISRPSVKAGLEARLARLGLAPGRVELLGGTPQPDHLAMHGRVDVMLDPFPHSGGASTNDALWMGVPVVTLHGRTVHGRLASSTLQALSLDRFVAAAPEQYVEIAVEAARDPAMLAGLRASLRARMAATPVGDTTRYVRAVEAVYRDIWRAWCAARH